MQQSLVEMVENVSILKIVTYVSVLTNIKDGTVRKREVEILSLYLKYLVCMTIFNGPFLVTNAVTLITIT